MIPADLLAALREKDPDLWEKYKQWSAHMDIYDETALQYILQGELQERIRGRGWWYQIATGYNGVIQAQVYCSEVGLHKGDTEAEALLRAYLAAIQEAA